MTDTKQDILENLARREYAAQELAARLSMTTTAIRNHVTELEAQGFVTHRKVGGKPSRPKFLYRLSDAGAAAFPHRYDLLAVSLVRSIANESGEAAALSLVEQAGADVASRQRLTRPSGPAPDRQRAVLGQMERELAWTSDIQVEASGAFRLLLYQCPFRSISREYLGTCPAFFSGLFRAAFGGGSVMCTAKPEADVCCRIAWTP